MKHSLAPGLLAGALVAALATSCAKAPPPAAPPAPKVTVALPQTMTVTNWDEYPGHLEAVEMVEIRPRVSGYIDSIHFTDGAEVKAGDLLFVDRSAAVPSGLGARPGRTPAGRDARSSWPATTSSAPKRLRGTQGHFRGGIRQPQQGGPRGRGRRWPRPRRPRTRARLNLDYTRIKAPINGRIGRRLVTTGNLRAGRRQRGGTSWRRSCRWTRSTAYFDVDEEAFLQIPDRTASEREREPAERIRPVPANWRW